jgi:hypothetical protein
METGGQLHAQAALPFGWEHPAWVPEPDNIITDIVCKVAYRTHLAQNRAHWHATMNSGEYSSSTEAVNLLTTWVPTSQVN